MVNKLKYLLFFIPLLFITNVNAETRTINFNSFNTTAESLTSQIQCNSSQCILYNVPFYNYQMNFEWGSTGSPTCSSASVVSGSLAIDNPSFGIQNNDFSWNRVYIVSNNNTYTCNWFANDDGTAFVCNVPSLSSDFKIGYTLNNTFGSQTTFNSIISRSFDINCDTSQSQVIENNNMNTDRIINNDINTSNAIINNQNQNTQDIINNQNSNSQKEIESQKVCSFVDNSFIITNNKYLKFDGTTNNSSTFGVTDFIPLKSTDFLKMTTSYSYSTSNASLCFYDNSKQLLSCIVLSSLTKNQSITIPPQTSYFKTSIAPKSNIPNFSICKNGNQALTDSITSDNAPNTSDELNDLDSSTASDTPISDLITLPITLINVFINGINSSCTPANLGNLYGTDLILPCINIEQRLGSNLWSTIDILFSIFMCYNIGMLFVTAFSGITSLRDDFDSLYQPKHADTGYQPKHGG